MGYLDGIYRKEDGRWLIELEVSDPRQLFNSLDPAPFRARDLDDQAVAYITGAVRDLPRGAPFRLRIHLPAAQLGEAITANLPSAIQHFFTYQAAVSARELRRTLSDGRRALAIGLSFLFLCIAARRFLHLLGEGTLAGIVEEGLLIMGWVAMWQPIQVFLYDWWPIRRRRDIERRLAGAEIEIRASR